MKTRILDHIDLRVTDKAAAERFYGRLLPALGFSVKAGDEECRTYQAPGDVPTEFFAFTEEPAYQPNETRIAFWAGSRSEVDRLATVAREAGAQKIEGPEIVPEYSRGYYAVFFEDPCGNKLEICFRETRPA